MAAATLSAAMLLVLVGCTPPAPVDPTPTPTSAFATEEEAFAAAEETYRAYVDAVNARREDSRSSPTPTDFLIGDALETDIETENLKAAEGLTIVGASVVTAIERISWAADDGEAKLAVCMDSSGTRVLDNTGADVTPADRQENYALTVELEVVGDALLIASTQQAADTSC
ncbi:MULTISPECIES: hypothetical protein [Microbacterium]|uniref:hypothetical protein n=1 Tax=Microbacterium TaxID=33882 RepID=UPI000D641F40|nr:MULTISPECIES: hypothetical protein [Microbacterium]